MNDTSQIKECKRCGTCCQKGGPALHSQDRYLVDEGKIMTHHLFTFRKGERAYDNVKDEMFTLTDDIVKIKSQKDNPACIFLNDAGNECNIYDIRPVECQTMQCWNTTEIEQLYRQNRLTRQDLLSDIQDLWELISEHQRRCDYNLLDQLVSKYRQNAFDEIKTKILEMIGFDMHIRKVIAENSTITIDQTDFLFGRPIVETITMLGIQVEEKNGQYSLKI